MSCFSNTESSKSARNSYLWLKPFFICIFNLINLSYFFDANSKWDIAIDKNDVPWIENNNNKCNKENNNTDPVKDSTIDRIGSFECISYDLDHRELWSYERVNRNYINSNAEQAYHFEIVDDEYSNNFINPSMRLSFYTAKHKLSKNQSSRISSFAFESALNEAQYENINNAKAKI